MMFMNDYDLVVAARRFDPEVVPNRAYLVRVVANLATWADEHSDGWAFWPKPCRAAAKAQALICSTAYPEYQRREDEDATDAETTAALKPIKAFLTRHHALGDTDWVVPTRTTN